MIFTRYANQPYDGPLGLVVIMNINSIKLLRSEVSRSEISRSKVSWSEVLRSEVSGSEVSGAEVSRHPYPCHVKGSQRTVITL